MLQLDPRIGERLQNFDDNVYEDVESSENNRDSEDCWKIGTAQGLNHIKPKPRPPEHEFDDQQVAEQKPDLQTNHR